MTKTYNQGDRVHWNTPQGETTGIVKKKLVEPTSVKDHKVAATPEEPQYLVESDKSGELAAHRPEALEKLS